MFWMDSEQKLRAFLRARNEKILLRSELQAMVEPLDLDDVLAALVAQGHLERINSEIFAKKAPEESARQPTQPPESKSVTQETSPKTRGQVETSVARFVRRLAAQCNVRFQPTFADQWAGSVTRLAGDDVSSDTTDDLLVALTRAGQLSPIDMTKLVMSHHREARSV